MQVAVVSLNPVSEADKSVLSRLLYDYQHELLPNSGSNPEEIKAYKYLPDYFTDPERAAFFITARSKIAGFVLINTHTIIESHAHSIAEFYVAPAFRRNGVGGQAAALAFAKFPGRWEVAQMEANQSAAHFWRKAVKDVTKGQYKETILDSDTWHGPVQTFNVD